MISIPAVFFVLEIIATETVFLHSFNRRRHFAARLIGSALVCLLFAMFFPSGIFPEHTFLAALLNFLRYFLLFSLTVLSAWFSFDAKFFTILYACTAGYALQHLTQRLFVVLGLFITPPFQSLAYPWNNIVRELICLVPLVPLYLVFLFKIGKNVSEKYYKNEKGNDPKLIIVSFATIFICMIVTRILDFEDMSTAVTLVTSIYAIICCTFVLLLKSSVMRFNRQERELELTRQLYAKEQEEYRSWQNSLDVINIKCHDLKHQIAALRNDFSEENIKEIEKSVMIYDSALKTGNEIIDVILFEKNVYCEQNGIQLIFMVDGAGLSFIEKSDLFSFFTNMLNNAIEAVMKADVEKRVINLTVRRVANMVVINEENYYTGEIRMKDDFPMTSKDDKENHGFGLKSMRRFAEKYGGTMTFSTDGEVFSLKMSLPCRDAQTNT